jgi:glycerol-3-phosphate acyltransferase PlsY
MNNVFLVAMLVVFGYLCGSIPFGKIIGNMHGIDIQKKGSGNIGFANALRVLGWKAGIVVLLGDVTKGFVPTYLATQHSTFTVTLCVGFVAILAHLFPVWLRFRGGKGIATGLGITLAISPLTGICGFGMYLVAVTFYKRSAIASLCGAWSLPLFAVYFEPRYVLFGFLLALLATYTHRTNFNYYGLRRTS